MRHHSRFESCVSSCIVSLDHSFTRNEVWRNVSQGGLFSYAVNYITVAEVHCCLVSLTKLYACSQAESSSSYFHFHSFLSDFFFFCWHHGCRLEIYVMRFYPWIGSGTASKLFYGYNFCILVMIRLSDRSFSPMWSIGITKDVSFRKQQLRNLQRFCEEHTETIQKALYADLRKHTIETGVGEISLVVEECRYMIKVHISYRNLKIGSNCVYFRTWIVWSSPLLPRNASWWMRWIRLTSAKSLKVWWPCWVSTYQTSLNLIILVRVTIIFVYRCLELPCKLK